MSLSVYSERRDRFERCNGAGSRTNPGRVKTFSIGFEDPSFDESRYALLASKHLGTEHHEQRMTPADLLDLSRLCPMFWTSPWPMPRSCPPIFFQIHPAACDGCPGWRRGRRALRRLSYYLAHKLARPYESCWRTHPVLSHLGSWLPVSDANISFDFKVKNFSPASVFRRGYEITSGWSLFFSGADRTAFREIRQVLTRRRPSRKLKPVQKSTLPGTGSIDCSTWI